MDRCMNDESKQLLHEMLEGSAATLLVRVVHAKQPIPTMQQVGMRCRKVGIVDCTRYR